MFLLFKFILSSQPNWLLSAKFQKKDPAQTGRVRINIIDYSFYFVTEIVLNSVISEISE
jgi:hypothetical protein